jgi:LPXTG-site transpeptidase (sortase) family protein
LFFVAEGIGSGREVWKTQPPYTEVSLVEDVFSGGASSNPKRLTAHGWTLFFVAHDSSGEELFKSIPPYNSASTERVKQINAEGYASPDSFAFIDDTLFFAATDRDGHRELWKSRPPYDEYSTELVDEFDERDYSSEAFDLHAANGTLLYTGYRLMSGFELRKVEYPYTATYMSRVEDIGTGFFSSMPDKKMSIDGTVFFIADDGVNGQELWKSEYPYTEESTDLVKDIRPGSAASQISDLTAAGDTLFFRADDGEFGMELWQSAPPYNENSTARVGDIQRGGSSSPTDLTAIHSSLIFAAGNMDYGRELWKVGRFYGLPNSGFALDQVTALPEQPAVQEYQTMETMILTIPDLGVATEIVGVPLGTTGWDTTWLGASAGYLASTAFPTHAGNTVLTAHAVLENGQPGPFHDLVSLNWGDRIEVQAWGERFVYEVRSQQVVSPDDASPLAHEDLDWLTLITCHDYDPETGDYASRLVVRAVLIEVVPE